MEEPEAWGSWQPPMGNSVGVQGLVAFSELAASRGKIKLCSHLVPVKDEL